MRMQWASAEIEKIWKPRLDNIHEMIQYLETHTVMTRARGGAIVSVELGSDRWYQLQEGGRFYILPFGLSKAESYSNESVFPTEKDRVNVRALVTKDRQGLPKNDDEWGKLLGYPSCCVEFFNEFWTKQRLRDLLPKQLRFDNVSRVVSDVTNNTSLRFVGVRPVFHLPCSFDCARTRAIAQYLKSEAGGTGYGQAWDWMEEILNKKYTVSMKNGVGEITHPFFRVCYEANSDDWSVTFDPTVRSENGFELFWRDNGFRNIFDMEQYHQEITSAVALLEGIDSIVDLGAGNGYLVSKLGRITNASKLYAVESEPDRCTRGSEMFPQVVFKRENIGSSPVGPVDLVLISERRFEDGVPREVVGLMAEKYLVVYSYDGGLKDVGEFDGMCLLSSSKNVALHRRVL